MGKLYYLRNFEYYEDIISTIYLLLLNSFKND